MHAMNRGKGTEKKRPRLAGLMIIFISLLLAAWCGVGAAAGKGAGESVHDENGDHAHPHHLSLILGGSRVSTGKNAFTYGIEYQYRVSRRLALGLFIEWSEGDFDAETIGVPLSIFVTDNLKVLLAAGVERELFKDDEFLARVGLGYDIHIKNFTIAPSGWVDFVNHKEILFLGLTFGIGF